MPGAPADSFGVSHVSRPRRILGGFTTLLPSSRAALLIQTHGGESQFTLSSESAAAPPRLEDRGVAEHHIDGKFRSTYVNSRDVRGAEYAVRVPSRAGGPEC